MEKYMNKEYKDTIESVKVLSGQAKDSGNTYYYLNIRFINGYEARLYATGDKAFAIQNALDLFESQKTIDSAF